MLKIIKIFIVLVSIAMMAPCYADEWAITIGGSKRDVFRALWKTLDGGYVLSGSTYSFGAGSYDQWIVKLNNDGIIEWQKTYGGIGDDGQGEITLKDDGGYFLTAETQTFGAGSYDYWIFNLNSDGTIIWQKTIGGAGVDWNVPKGQQTADGGYIIEGSTNSFGVGSHDFWVLKLYGNGNIEWQKTYGGSSGDGPSNIQQTLDGGFIIAGGTYSFGADGRDIWVLKLNSDGTIAWQKTYGGNNDDNASRIRQTSDGGYILVAHTNSFGAGDYDVLVLKLNASGTIAWQKAYGGIDHEYPEIIEQTMDGGYIVGTATHSFGAGGREAWVLKLNANGTIAWQKTYGGVDDDHDGYIHLTADGGYIMAVPTDSFGAGNMDTLVLKLDENGDIPGCDIIGESIAIVTDTSVIVEDTNVVPQDSSAIVTDTNVVPQDTNVEPDIICYFSGFEQSEIIGTWSSGIWHWDVAASSWTQMYSGLPSAALAAGDFTGDQKADVASIWSSGLWYQNGDTLGWTQVYHTAPDRIAAGDITGDGVDEIIGCGGAWGKGVWYRDVVNGTWHHPWSGPPVGAVAGDCPLNDTPDGPIAAGDVTGDGKADMVSCWNSGLWYQDGATLAWTKVYSYAPYNVTCGEVTGDGQAEIISTWSNGFWYWDVAASSWTHMTSYVTKEAIAAGDFTGDGIADVASCWKDYGLWYQDGDTLGWTKVTSTAPYTVTAGDVTGK